MNSVIRDFSVKPFSYDGADCCAFVAACLKHSTGKDLNFQYRTEDEANALIDRFGGLEGAISDRLGQPTDEAVQDGFVVVVQSGRQIVAGIVHKGRILVRNQRSIIDLSLDRALVWWNPCHQR